MDHTGRKELRRLLPLAILTTATVILLPATVVLAALALLEPDPNPLLTSAIGVAVAVAVTVIGSIWWMRVPASRDVSFGELMIWGWLRRKRAEDRLVAGTQLLGLNRSGQVERGSRITLREQIDVLRDLSAALESKDPYTHGHSRRVERHAYRTALAMGLSVTEIEDLRIAASLHDVGKIRVSDRVLRKPGRLTEEERAIMQEHVAVGAWMVSRVGSVDVILAVRHHHEHWNGAGYPDGLSGADIPLFARIIAVADAFDAITSTRPYRAKAARERAVEILRVQAGEQFDPDIVEAFLKTLPAPAPIPVAISLLFLGGGRRLLRELAVLAKRVGAASIAPAATAAGAAVVLGVSAMSPTIVPPPSSAPQIVIRTLAGSDGSQLADHSLSSIAKSDLAAAPGSTVLGTRIHRSQTRRAAHETLGPSGSNAAPPPNTDAEGSAGAGQSPNPKDKPEPKPDPTPTVGSGQPDTDEAERCHKHKNDKEKDSPGHRKHCG